MKRIKEKLILLRRSKFASWVLKQGFYVIGLLPKDNKAVVFESFHGKQFSDNPRAIFEYMSENYKEYTLYWSVDKGGEPLFKKNRLNYIRRFSLKWFLVMPRAKYWIVNTRLPNWFPKSAGTTYVQTWHGTPLKKLGVDIETVHMPNTNTENYKKNFLYEASKWDYLISANQYSSQIFKKAFGFNKTLLETGYPRNDFLIKNNDDVKIRELKNKLGLPCDKKIVLYAPTWRDNQYYSKGKYKFNTPLDLYKLKEELEDDYIILLRLHYLVAENISLSEFEGFVYDYSNWEDIRELYVLSDVLITDYSSVFFDYANLSRPILFYVYDIDEYRDTLRGFYMDFETDAPGPLLRTTEELIKELISLEKNNFIPSAVLTDFKEKYCYLDDGEASKRVVHQVFE